MGSNEEMSIEWVFVPQDDQTYPRSEVRITGTREGAKAKIKNMFKGKNFYQYAGYEWDSHKIPH